MPKLAPHRGSMLIVLSICGWLVCGILSPITWILARGDLNRMDEGRMDSSGAGTTQTAKVIAMIHCILMIVSLVVLALVFILFAGAGAVALQDANRFSGDAVESSVEEIGPAAQLSRIISDLGSAVNQQMKEGRQLVKQLQIEGAEQPGSESPVSSAVAFEYSFPIVINGRRKENLSRHEGTFNFRDGQWHLDRVAVSFKFFDTEEFSPPVNLLVEPVEDTPDFHALKTMWLQTVEQSIASMTSEQNRKKAEQEKRNKRHVADSSRDESDGDNKGVKKPGERDSGKNWDQVKLKFKEISLRKGVRNRLKQHDLDSGKYEVTVLAVTCKWNKLTSQLEAQVTLDTSYATKQVQLHFWQLDNREGVLDPWTLLLVDTGKPLPMNPDFLPKLKGKLRSAFERPVFKRQ